MVGDKPRRRWQNLLHKKCPNCNSRLESSGMYLKCPNKDETETKKDCFFIKKSRAVELLLDTEHPANFCLSPHERETIEEKVLEITKSV